MDIPLELATVDGVLHVGRTADASPTRLVLEVWPRSEGLARLDLGVLDVRILAGALLQWLADQGHDLPESPATDGDLEDMDGDDG